MKSGLLLNLKESNLVTFFSWFHYHFESQGKQYFFIHNLFTKILETKITIKNEAAGEFFGICSTVLSTSYPFCTDDLHHLRLHAHLNVS